MTDAAARDIRHLREAKSSRSARDAWVSFLENANRALNRLEGYSKRTGQTQKYKDLLTKEVWTTDLTRYMRTARNAHEHGVDELHAAAPYSDRIVFPDGQILGGPTIYAENAEGRMVIAGAQIGPTEILEASPGVRLVSLKPGIKMVPLVTPKGETIMPPWVQLETEDEPETVAAARLYLKWVMEQIGTFA